MLKKNKPQTFCAITLSGRAQVNPGKAGVLFCTLGHFRHCFTHTTRVVAGLSLAKAHLKKSGGNLHLTGSGSLHHTHTFSLIIVNTS